MKRRRALERLSLACLLAALMAAAMWQAAQFARRTAIAEMRDQAGRALERSVANLQGLLDTYHILPRLLAQEPLVRQLLAAVPTPAQRSAVNAFLADFNQAAGASETYVLDTAGETLAASNAEADVSFVGRNFGFRPYFQLAMAGRAGLYFAHGITSNRAGFYFSFPVREHERVLGVAVVKIGQERLEAAWSQSTSPIVVTDAAGVVFITNRSDFRYHTLRPLDAGARQALQRSRQYGDAPLRPLPVVAERVEDGAHTLTLQEVDGADGPGKPVRYLLETSQVPSTEWIVHTLLPMDPVAARVGVAVLLSGSVAAIALMLGLLLRQRRQRLRERLAYQARVAQALRKARDQLEARVSERTRDLTAANARLSREIRSRETAEHALVKAQDDLIQASKLAALGQLAAGMVHELNQPLAAIRAYAANAVTFLERERPAQARDNLGLIGELTERMATLTAELKTFARRTSDETAEIDPRVAVSRALALLEPRLHKDGIELALDLPEQALTVRANLIRLEQVLVNLIKNAADALHGHPAPRIELGLSRAAARVRLSVRDNGPGIEPEAASQLFDPFYTTKPVGEGLGLGLSISYGIVHNLGGSLHADNHADGGALFIVELPLVHAESP
ncbi:ATP-binding protein [Plasticicumulans acidivorans]|uniref:C4-dicarboxylate transport sensor protein DctB n=1 Tax=Plasticicumulans acidivorans TaxID=886464 RepID=A0A317MUL6_9GAMM|nr:ATP-binding protein [Plasticicumulans acidivorans]PWV61598.1 two-component system C4-dicarboxylate transport sensor histidine kinase DctB [Plasticicumulans acidivorans]